MKEGAASIYSIGDAVKAVLRNRVNDLIEAPYLMPHDVWEEPHRQALRLHLITGTSGITKFGAEVVHDGLQPHHSLLRVISKALDNEWLGTVAAVMLELPQSLAASLGKGLHMTHASECQILKKDEPMFLESSDVSLWVWRYSQWLVSSNPCNYAEQVGAEKHVFQNVKSVMTHRYWWLDAPTIEKNHISKFHVAIALAYPDSVCSSVGNNCTRQIDGAVLTKDSKSFCLNSILPLFPLRTQGANVLLAHGVPEQLLILAAEIHLSGMNHEHVQSAVTAFLEV